MKVTTCSICTGPVFSLPGETGEVDCTSCREKPEGLCRASGCGQKLRAGTKTEKHGFCPGHYDVAYACQFGRSKKCPDRAAADSAGRFCIVHGVRAERLAESNGSPDIRKALWTS